MAITFFNTLTRQAEPFTPITPGEAKLYTCGPTVYNYAHIGNFRAYVFEDLLRRTLDFCGLKVTHVMNLTDVDDKTIRDSQKAGLSLDAFTKIYKDAFFTDLDTLRIRRAEHYPAATDNIPQMIAMIETLLEKGFAYVGDDGSVYYSITRFPDYGKLAKIDLEGQMAGARIKADEYGKESVADFALWKLWDDADGDVKWDSPWGAGRPGWHIECSAMATRYLGPHFDLHTGGVDNMFPHHEDEIAQSEACTGHKFVNVWLHCEHLMVDGKKMSKSLGNFYTLRDLTGQGWSGREIRYVLLAAHYRAKLNFTFTGLEAARTVLRRFDDFSRRLKETLTSPAVGTDTLAPILAKAEADFRAGIEDDLNIAASLGALFDLMRDVNRSLDEGSIGGAATQGVLDLLARFDTVLSLLEPDADDTVPAEILAMVEARQAARKARDFAEADRLRDAITAAGWRLEDTPKGPRVVPG